MPNEAMDWRSGARNFTCMHANWTEQPTVPAEELPASSPKIASTTVVGLQQARDASESAI
jgi:hypothetical protein